MTLPPNSNHQRVPGRPIANLASEQCDQRLRHSQPARLSPQNAAFLHAALLRQPEIRPDVVERARTLLHDPDYPSLEVLRNVAAQILCSPDFSEVEN
jgi:hypothetical protein